MCKKYTIQLIIKSNKQIYMNIISNYKCTTNKIKSTINIYNRKYVIILILDAEYT